MQTGMMGRLAIALTVCAAGSPAMAQEFDPFGSIEMRPRDEYSAKPINVGSLEFLPRIEIETEYVDNLFASDVINVDETILSIKPRLLVRDRRADRQLRLDLLAGYSFYLQDEVDDRLQLAAHAEGRFGLGTRTRPFFGLRVQQNDSTSRQVGELRDIAQPLKLLSYGGNAGVEQEFGPFTAVVDGRYEKTEYEGDTIVGGTPVDASFRDYSLKSARLRFAYSVNPAQRVYVQGEFNKRDYGPGQTLPGVPDVFISDRSSDGFTVRLGYSRQLTELLMLDVNVGYLRQDYDDPAFDTISTLSFDANLYFSPSRLTRVQLRASRSIDDTVNPLFNGLVRTEIAGVVEHELRRNLILTGEARYADIDAGNTIGDSREVRFAAQVRYLISPQWFLRVRAEHFSRDSVSEGKQNRIMAGIGYNF